MAGDVRPSTAYYVAIVVLIVGLLVGSSLFVLLSTRPGLFSKGIQVGGAQSTTCPVGGHAPVCYRFEVTNRGNDQAFVSCTLISAPGTAATFQSIGTVKSPETVQQLSLPGGQSESVDVRVVPDGGDTVAAPRLSCNPIPS